MKCPMCKGDKPLSIEVVTTYILNKDNGKISDHIGPPVHSSLSPVNCHGCGFTGPAMWFEPTKMGDPVFVTASNEDRFYRITVSENGDGKVTIESVVSVNEKPRNIDALNEAVSEAMTGNPDVLTDINCQTMSLRKGALQYLVSGELDAEDFLNFLEEMVSPEDVVTCKLCQDPALMKTAHLHQDGYVGMCCWDERLRATE